MLSYLFITVWQLVRLILFAEQETEDPWIHWMFAYGNILFFIGKYCEIHLLFRTLCICVVTFWATVCKMVRPMLSDCCPVCHILSVCL